MNLGPTELILILAVALVIFGPGKLPELGQMLYNQAMEKERKRKNG